MGRKAGAVTAPTFVADTPETTALAPVAPITDPLSLLVQAAKDPGVDADKIGKLVALQEHIMAVNAKAAFDAAFSVMQNDLPEIDERGKIVVKGVLRSTYAKFEDIQKAVRPVLKEHGFALRHRTEWPAEKAGIIRIVGILSHEAGHSEESAFEAPADRSDFRTDIQSQGSTVSYGRRYTTIDLLNIITRGVDNDGRGGQASRSEPTDGEAQHAHNPHDTRPITDAQRQRLFMIAKTAGRQQTEIKMWLKVRYNLDSSKAITRGQYDEVCKAIEAPGALPVPEDDDREPGMDG